MALGIAQVGSQVDASAHLERSNGVMVLVFDVDPGAQQITKPLTQVQRRAL